MLMLGSCRVTQPELPDGRRSAAALSAPGEPITVYVVRHAEKATDIPGFPFHHDATPLSAEGMQRASDLRDHLLRESEPSLVFSTRTVRTWETAAPTASAAKLDITPYEDRLPELPGGASILVVSHSGMVERIVSELAGGVQVPPIGDEFDNLFVVKRRNGRLTVEHRQYGSILSLGRIEFAGALLASDARRAQAENFSAVEAIGRFLLVGPDEGTEVLVFERSGDRYELASAIPLDDPDAKEIDIEGVA